MNKTAQSPANATPERVDPFFKSLHDEIENVFSRFGTGLPMTTRDLWARGIGPIAPTLDIADTEEVMEITAELPGVSEADIDVSITDGVLTIKGEKSSDHEQKEEDYHLVERRYGSFRRSVTLGFTPEEGKVKATMKDGVLRLRIEKPELVPASTRKIEIGKG